MDHVFQVNNSEKDERTRRAIETELIASSGEASGERRA